jgi:hypothetical protein
VADELMPFEVEMKKVLLLREERHDINEDGVTLFGKRTPRGRALLEADVCIGIYKDGSSFLLKARDFDPRKLVLV